MLNEEKIRLMTELAIFEKHHGAQMKTAATYFKSDYVSRSLIRGFLGYTVCSAVAACVWSLFNVDTILSSIGMEQIQGLAMRGGALYLGGLAVYEALIAMVYGRRYDYEGKMNRIYIIKLKHLDKRYEFHSRSRELAREGKRV